jgi:hypothetical protein
VTRKQIEYQAALARKLDAEPVKHCTFCRNPLRGMEKLGSVCRRCMSERAGGLIPSDETPETHTAFIDALAAFAEPSEEDITIAHCCMQVEL